VTLLALAGVALVVDLYYLPGSRGPVGPTFPVLLVMLTMGLLASALSIRMLSLLGKRRWALIAAAAGLAGGLLAYVDVRAGANRMFPPSWALVFYGLGALLAIGVPALLAFRKGDEGKRRRDRLALSLGLFAAVSYTLVAILGLLMGTR